MVGLKEQPLCVREGRALRRQIRRRAIPGWPGRNSGSRAQLKAPEGWRTSKPRGWAGGFESAIASWSAPALWRFDPIIYGTCFFERSAAAIQMARICAEGCDFEPANWWVILTRKMTP